MFKQILSTALAAGLIASAMPAPAFAHNGEEHHHVKHVLLISVDGLHALDVANYVGKHKDSALAELGRHGLTFSNARTPSNSDSFPGLMALTTGGTPNSTGLLYDVSYARDIFDPTNPTCSGQVGNTMVFDETIDKYDSNNVSLNVIDPTTLPNHFDENGNCARLYPHNAIHTNTIFEVVKAHGGRTAWEDKHPAYDWVNGPSGTGVDDLYTPEITNAPGFDNTISVVCTSRNDELKVQGILNEIKGLTHDGQPVGKVPAVFGMNFQSVSVGQKLHLDNPGGGCANDPLSGQHGGYLDGKGTPTAVLQYGLDYVDGALGRMIAGLKAAGIYDSTLFIVTAKHGQSPISPLKLNKPGHFADLVAGLPDANTNPAALAIAAANNCSTGPCGFVQDDDIALIWLQDQSQTGIVRNYLNTNAQALFIDEVLAGNELTLKFNSPLHDARIPDIIVQPIYGTIYTKPAKNKVGEHGGFSFGDTNVGLIVSLPGIGEKHVTSPVTTAQVAATILKALDIDPSELKAVRKEGTTVLPFVFEGDDE